MQFLCRIWVSSFGGSGCVGGWAFNFLSRGSGGPLLDYRAGAFSGAIRSVKKYLVMISSPSLLFLLHHNKEDQMAWLKRHSYDCSNSCFLVLWLPFLPLLLNWFRLELYLAFFGEGWSTAELLMGLEHEPIKGVGRVRRSPIDINYSMGRTFTLIPWTLR